MDDKVRYIALLSKLRNVARELETTINNIERFKSKAKEAILINDVISFDKDFINVTAILKSRLNKIRYTIIPAIERKIESL